VKVARTGKIFYGWWIVLAAAVGLLFASSASSGSLRHERY
jgi:hypothetical protein